MEGSGYIKIVQIVGIIVGCFTPIVGYLTIRIIKSNDAKTKELYDMCGEIKERLSLLEEAVRWLKER